MLPESFSLAFGEHLIFLSHNFGWYFNYRKFCDSSD